MVALLREAGLHPGLNIIYGWCPLVLKEFANGGHLDSIVIFFTTLAIFLLVRAGSRQTNKPFVSLILSAMILALAIGAKLYPVVLLPLFAMIWWRHSGIKSALFGTLVAILMASILVCPMLVLGTQKNAPTVASQHDKSSFSNVGSNFEEDTELPSGLQAFLRYWEMNDLIFMILQVNLRPQSEVIAKVRPWFVIIPDKWSTAVVDSFSSLLDRLESIVINEKSPTVVDVEKDTSFLLARLLASVIFCFIACKVAWRASAIDDPQAWCRAAMLTIAWFWLLCPTQNPWYWCWVVPLLPFARYRTWYLVAGCTMLYYLRLWLAANYPEPPFLGTVYGGEYFFHFVVVWVEFAPCLLLLGIEWYRSRREIFLRSSPV